MTLHAQVAVLSGSPVRDPFTYSIPAGLNLRRGDAVVVPWRSQYALGIVLAVESDSDYEQARPVEAVLDEEPLLDARQLDLANWIADHYLAPIADCVALFLPPGTPRRAKRSAAGFRPVVPGRRRRPARLSAALNAAEFAALIDDWPQSRRSRPATLLDALRGGPLTLAEAARSLGGSTQLRRWLERTSMALAEDDVVRLAVSSDEAAAAAAALRRTAAERRQLRVLREVACGEVDEADVRRVTGATRADVALLERLGYVRRAPLLPAVSAPVVAESPPILTDAQAAAVDALGNALAAEDGSIHLLHGVTGSGKTEVYLAATRRALEAGGGVVVLVPEIALAPQTVARFEARFPGQVAVQHSELKVAEAREQWRQVQSGEKRILVGARSALFGPLGNLALVILDEEHEWTYKQTDPQPRYHARSVAEQIADDWGVVTLLGSATPDLLSMANARAGRAHLLVLPERLETGRSGPHAVIPQPMVDVVDMREELHAGVRSVFSRALDAAISDALTGDEQSILFLNRRGLSGLVCRNCGETVQCRDCAIALTLHRPGPLLRCHECGRREPPPARCPSCGDERIRAMSFGADRLVDEVRRRWGEVGITRWDRDSARRVGHAELLREFAEGRSQILVGTQMIAKGLDLPRVTLAGVVNADLSLREADYAAAERTFQLLTQVAGRAGRGAGGGRVIVQTYAPDHYAVVAAAANDYDVFYESELRLRAGLDLPPFARLARLTVARTSAAEADLEAERMAELLRSLRLQLDGSVAEVVGPAPAWPERRRGQHRRQLLVRGSDPAALLREVEFPRGWAVDVDPVGGA